MLKGSFSRAAKWCREHGAEAERLRLRNWNKKAGAIYKAKPRATRRSQTTPHDMAIALLAGRDPFR